MLALLSGSHEKIQNWADKVEVSWRILELKVEHFPLRNFKGKWSVSCSVCPTLCNPIDCSPPGSSVHGISQAKILEWVALPFFKWSSPPRDLTWVSCIEDRWFMLWATGKQTWWKKQDDKVIGVKAQEVRELFSPRNILLKYNKSTHITSVEVSEFL